MSTIETFDNTLFFDGCDTVKLAAEFGTPLYVYSRTEIERRCEEIRDSFLKRYANTRAAYASKAFLTLAMCQIIKEQGLSLDVVSGGELYTAITAGFPAEQIEFHGNNKSQEELKAAIEYGVGTIIVDAEGELETIESLLEGHEKKMNVLFRITPEVDAATHHHISTGHKGSKFGFSMDENIIYPLLKKAIDSPFVTLAGLHFHIGSQLFSNDTHLQALEQTLPLYKGVFERFGVLMPEINVGGGFGARYTADDDRKPLSYFTDPIMARIEGYFADNGLTRPTVVIEPGRSIVAEAGITLYTVGGIRDIAGVKKYISIDGGMSDNIRPALYGAKYEGMIANKANAEELEQVTVCGKLCESGDKLIDEAYLAKAEKGDILAIFSTGAYGYSMSSNYNKQLTPAVLLVEKGAAQLIVKRQTLEDLIRNELPLG